MDQTSSKPFAGPGQCLDAEALTFVGFCPLKSGVNIEYWLIFTWSLPFHGFLELLKFLKTNTNSIGIHRDRRPNLR